VRPANTPGSGLYLIRTAYRTADGGRVDVTAVGELDMAEEARFREAVLDPLRQQSVNRVVVDLGRLRFMDASGANVLIEAHQEAMRRAKRFHIVKVCGCPAECLRSSASATPSPQRPDRRPHRESGLQRTVPAHRPAPTVESTRERDREDRMTSHHV
jgi:anti-anti-sigma factor